MDWACVFFYIVYIKTDFGYLPSFVFRGGETSPSLSLFASKKFSLKGINIEYKTFMSR